MSCNHIRVGFCFALMILITTLASGQSFKVKRTKNEKQQVKNSQDDCNKNASPQTGQTIEPLDSVTFSTLIHQQLTKVVSGESRNSIANFASLDTKDARLSFNGVIPVKKTNVFTVRANAAVTEGVSSLFTNSRSNANISLDLKFHLLSPRCQTVIYDLEDREKVDLAVEKLDSTARTEIHNLSNRYTLVLQVQKLLKDSVSKIDAEIIRKNHSIDTAQSLKKKKELLTELTKLIADRQATELLDDSIMFLKRRLIDIQDEEHRLRAIRNARIEKVKDQFKATGFKITWITFGYTFNNKNFFLYDSLKPFEDQVKKEDFNAHQFSIEFNRFTWNLKGWESRMVTAGVAVMLDDTKDDLESVDITDSRSMKLGSNTRQHQYKYTGYVGNYEKGILATRL